MLSQSGLIARFSAGATAGRASNMFAEGEVLYSYGRHFPLAIRRDWGADIRYLVNGDRYSISTASHQRQCISRLTPNVQVPFSALETAGLTRYGLPTEDLLIVACEHDTWHLTCKACGREVEYQNGAEAEPDQPAGYHHADDLMPLCGASDEPLSHHVLGGVVLVHDGMYFLSSVDAQEDWRIRAYFLCELPRAVSSVKEAFDVLVPEEVREARASGAEVRRQGDIFAIRTDLATRRLPRPSERGLRVFGTTHVATEARLNGAVYIRGTLRHLPSGRAPQHRALALGKSWWIAVKNLARGSWNAAGNVD